MVLNLQIFFLNEKNTHKKKATSGVFYLSTLLLCFRRDFVKLIVGAFFLFF